MVIVSRVQECMWGNLKTRDFTLWDTIAVHRISVGETAREISDFFKEKMPEYGGMPYSIIVTRYGVVEQAVRLSRVTNHALVWNRRSIAVGVVKEEKEIPSEDQYRSLVWACVELSKMNPLARVLGHDEMHGGSSDKNKVCPGLDMDKLRSDVNDELWNQTILERLML